MIWFAGLGNPGTKYAGTRHNVGFMAVDRFAEKWGLDWKSGKFRADIAEGRVNGARVALIKPLTFMNLSGEAVRAFADYYRLSVDQMVVIYDDLDTEFGKMRLRYKGSAGGHNGIKSIIAHMGTQEFKRIRIGISRPPAGEDVVPYVLSDFPRSARDELAAVLDKTCNAMEDLLQQPFDKVMARYNG